MPSRRSVLSRLGLLSAAVALRPDSAFATTAPLAGDRLRADDWDLSWLDDLKGKHKQVFDCGTFTDEDTPTHVAANWLDAHQEVFGLAYPEVNALMGIAFNAFPLNASSALWKKYALGEMWKIHDRETGEWAVRHVLYEPPAELPDNRARRLAKMTVKSLQSRGAIFWQCNNALIGIAHMLGERTSQPWEAVYEELKAGLVPGVRLVPAHTLLIGLVQERGCTYEKV